MLVNKSKLRTDFQIDESELERIKCFLQGAVYCWIKNRKDEFFAARDLVGGENYDWTGTPLIVLYEKHLNLGKNESMSKDEAGKEVGWILKLVLSDDNRTFEDCDMGKAKGYRWVK